MSDLRNSPPAAPAPSPPPGPSPEAPGPNRLRGGSLNAAHIVFMVIAAAAPMAVVVAILPIAFAFGNGVGTPGMYVVASLTLAVFAVGYTRATPFVRNAGAFYAYIAHGLNRTLGLVAAYVAAICYTSLAAATCGALAFFSHDTFARLLHVDLPWPVWAAVWIAVVGFLGYRRITMAATVLAVALTAEVALIGVLDIAIVADRGLSALQLDVFAPANVFGAGVGVAVIYAFTSYLGFEGTAIYAEEAKDPARTIPRATYGAIAVVGIFYVFTAWCLIAGVGFDDVAAVAGQDPGTFVFGVSDRFLSTAWTDALSVLIVTSSFAAVLAFHNAASRYVFALARDGAMPRALARTHPRWGSPYRAGLAQIAVLAVVVGGFAIAGLDPLLNLSTAMTGFGAVGLLALMAVTSASIAVLLWNRGMRGIAATVCPVLAAVGLTVATVLSISNYPDLTGSDSSVINALPWLHVPVVLGGIAVAAWLRRKRPAVYARLGSTRVEGPETP